LEIKQAIVTHGQFCLPLRDAPLAAEDEGGEGMSDEED
jgi:hypothetical protein